VWLGHGPAPPKLRPRQEQPKPKGRPRKDISQSALAGQWLQRTRAKMGAASAAMRGHGAIAPDGDQRDHEKTWLKRPAVTAADDGLL
jgi:hypothetical protein